MAEPEATGDEPAPPHLCTLAFSFEFAPPEPPAPPEEPPEEEPPAPPTLDGTFFALTVGGAEEEVTFELAHPLSGEGAPESSTAELTVTEALVRWLVVDQQAIMALSLRRRGPAEGGDPAAASHEVAALPLDVAGLVFGQEIVGATYEPGASAPDAWGEASRKAADPLPLPEAAAALASRLRVTVRTADAVPLLPEALAEALNPLMVTVVRAEGLPPDYSGDNRIIREVERQTDDEGRFRPGALPKYRPPYDELRSVCAPVSVRWHLLGASHTTRGIEHGTKLKWKERRLMLAGELGQAELQRQLRDEQIIVEVRDRDPIPGSAGAIAAWGQATAVVEEEAPPSKKATPRPGSGKGGKKEASRPASGKGKKGAKEATPVATPRGEGEAEEGAEAEAEPEFPHVVQPPPYGIARAKLGDLIPKKSTQRSAEHLGETRYAPNGVPVGVSRRMTLTLQVEPCPRPKEKPPPEAEVIPYYPGAYVENATCVTLKLELARPLKYLEEIEPERSGGAKTTDELQRMVALIRYDDTPTLLALMRIITDINHAADMLSASNWETYKDNWREELDIISGVQLVDGEVRLFLLEGQPAITSPDGTARNGMARLGALFARDEVNSATSFALADTHLLFPCRLYNHFETPTKLIKLRAPLPSLLRRPELYQHMRVKEGCQMALLRLGGLLRCASVRLAHKNDLFPHAEELLQMEKKYAAVILRMDREGVPMESDESMLSEAQGGGGGARSVRSGSKSGGYQKREVCKAPTDSFNPDFDNALRERPFLAPLDYIGNNKVIAPPPERAPLPDWYLASIPQVAEGEMVYGYSGQRLNHTEVQKANLRETLYAMGSVKGALVPTYNANYLSMDEMGERELPKVERGDKEEGMVPWNVSAAEVALKSGVRSRFRMLQPSGSRVEELAERWMPPEVIAAEARAAEAQGATGKDGVAKPRFDALASRKEYLDENPAERFRSVFQLTEEQAASEQAHRIDGEIDAWRKKVVVDTPQVLVNMRSRDSVCQQDRLKGMLHEHAKKRALRNNYHTRKEFSQKHHMVGGNHRNLTGTDLSIFIDSSTVEGIANFEENLRVREPAKWSSTKLTGKATDMWAGVIPPHESLLPVSVQTKRSILPLDQHEKTGTMWGTERTRKSELSSSLKELGGRLS